jgi:hypothetical protein
MVNYILHVFYYDKNETKKRGYLPHAPMGLSVIV